MNQFPNTVTPLLASTFASVVGKRHSHHNSHLLILLFHTAQPTTDLEGVVQKEAVYCSVGRCATKLKHDIPFNQWIERTLPGEVRSTNPR